jgi:hypothetical protein
MNVIPFSRTLFLSTDLSTAILGYKTPTQTPPFLYNSPKMSNHPHITPLLLLSILLLFTTLTSARWSANDSDLINLDPTAGAQTRLKLGEIPYENSILNQLADISQTIHLDSSQDLRILTKDGRHIVNTQDIHPYLLKAKHDEIRMKKKFGVKLSQSEIDFLGLQKHHSEQNLSHNYTQTRLEQFHILSQSNQQNTPQRSSSPSSPPSSPYPTAMSIQQTDPGTTPTAPKIGAPKGFIPLRQSSTENLFFIDIAIGSIEVGMLRSLVLDTTGEFLITLTPAACQSLSPTLKDCKAPSQTFPAKFNLPNMFIDLQSFYCTQCYVGSDTAHILWSRDGSSLTQTVAPVDFIVAASVLLNGTATQPPLYNILPFRGFFGLGAPSSNNRPVNADYRRPVADLISMLINDWVDYPLDSIFTTKYNFGLDLILSPNNSTSQSRGASPYLLKSTRLLETTSRLYLNGIPDQFKETMQWSLHPASYRSFKTDNPTVSYPIFVAYNIQLCNNLLYKQLPVIIDTMSPCLGVPRALFDSLMSWIPMECDFSLSDDGNRQCYYTSNDLLVPNLPTLQFAMSDTDISTNQLFLPLDQLLLPQNYLTNVASKLNVTNAQRMCITTSPERFYINMGNIPLSSFYFHRDFSSGYTGLANKVAQEAQLGQCIPRLQCIGQETSYSAYNYCFPPVCSAYWFFSYDHNSRTCKLNPGYPIILAVMIVIFAAVEAWFFFNENDLDKEIREEMPKMTLVQRSDPRRAQRAAARLLPGTQAIEDAAAA